MAMKPMSSGWRRHCSAMKSLMLATALGLVATECTTKCVRGACSFEASRCAAVPCPYMSTR